MSSSATHDLSSLSELGIVPDALVFLIKECPDLVEAILFEQGRFGILSPAKEDDEDE